jgi:hypothetical protein
VRDEKAVFDGFAEIGRMQKANGFQIRSLSTIYNQIVKEMHVHFSERKTMALMLRLEKATKEITALAKNVISLAHTMKRINFTRDDYV